MIKREKNPRKQGDAGLGVAIGWFAVNGYTVCVPLTDSQSFDLVVAKNHKLLKVFVRTTTRCTTTTRFKSNRTTYTCGLKTQGGNKSQFTIRKFDAKSVDLVFIVCGDGSKFLIPSGQIKATNSVMLGRKFARFLVT